MAVFAAVDLGASSARVMRAEVSAGAVAMAEVHRVENRPVTVDGTLHWDVLALWAGVQDGLRVAGADGDVAGIAVDGWAVDYGLLDADGHLLANPVHYRDARTDGVPDVVSATVPAAELYARTGIQVLPINTIYQLVAARDTAVMRQARSLLLMPDLMTYWLTGQLGCELTNASTTGVLDAASGGWASDLMQRLGLRQDMFAPLRAPGTEVGPVRDGLGADGAVVSLVGSHDTASAVVGVPAVEPGFAYISCGTWSLAGVELPGSAGPVTTDAAREANFTNELGVDGTVRFLRNVMGLWLLQESLRTWSRSGQPVDLDRLLAEAATVPRRAVIDPDRSEFLPPGDQPSRLRAECRRTGQPEPESPAEVVRCILDSLAAAYRRAVHQAAEQSGTEVRVVHLVGGGARNELLCQLTADACELPVVAGPVEAAAYGNVLVQARTAGVLNGDLTALRESLRDVRTRRYEPSTGPT